MASTELRAAAQQALEALDGGAHSWRLIGPAIDALRAALAEPVQDHFPDATKMVQEPVAYSVGRTLYWHEGKGVNDVQLYLAPPQRPAKPQGCDHCNHPLYAATKCRVCGRAHGIGGEG